MVGPVGMCFVAVVVLAVVMVWVIVHRRQPAELSERVALVIAAARRRALVAVAFALVVFIAAAAAGLMFPALLGMPLAAAPLVAGTAGMLLYAATPPRSVSVPVGQARSANPTRRSWLTVTPRRSLLAFGEIAVIFVIVVVFCGATAHTDDHGRSRSIRFESAIESSASSPYPGWFYGIPALIALLLLVAAMLVALQRIGATTALPDPQDADADVQWRRASVGVVLKLATAAVLFSLGGISLIAGSAIHNAVIEATAILWSIIADILFFGGFLFLILSVVSVTLAALSAFTIGEKLSRVPEPVA